MMLYRNSLLHNGIIAENLQAISHRWNCAISSLTDVNNVPCGLAASDQIQRAGMIKELTETLEGNCQLTGFHPDDIRDLICFISTM
jgi:hypothetical protein